MAKRLETVGLNGIGEKELERMLLEHIGDAEMFEADGERFAKISMGDGLVYWLGLAQTGGRDVPVCHDFHFHSDSRAEFYFCSVVSEGDRRGMSGIVRGDVSVDAVPGNMIEINLSVPMLAPARKMESGNCHYAQIDAYAEEVRYWPDMDTFRAAQSEGWNLGMEHLIPCGILPPKNDPYFRETPRVLLGGVVTKAERCTNSLTGQEYRHIVLDSIGVEYDVLAAVDDFGTEPVPGGILHGRFWLGAMLYTQSDIDDYYELTDLPEENGIWEGTFEDRCDSGSCTMEVTRPVSGHMLDRIAYLVSSLEMHCFDFLILDFADRDPNDEFIQTCVESLVPEKLFRVEYSCVENGKKIIRARRHLKLPQVTAIMAQACSIPPEKFDFSRWLDIGWKDE